MTHLINRLKFEVNCPDEEQAFHLRHNFAITYQEQISEVINEVCSRYADENESLRIDKLEIDLGRFSPHSFEINFAEVFQNKFEKELAEKISGFSSSYKKIPQRLSDAGLFEYFLKKGTLPWWANEAQINLDELSRDLLIDQPEALKHFYYQHRFEESIWQRTTLQINADVKAAVILFFDELINAKKLFSIWMEQINVVVADKINPEHEKAELMLNNLILKNAASIFRRSKDKNIARDIFEDNISEFFPGNKLPAEQLIALLRIGNEEGENNTNAGQLNPAQDSMQTDAQSDHNIIYPETSTEEESENKYFVKHAGIVLLAPFLKSLFSNLNLLDSIEWKSKDAQYRAIHLLKFLSTGEQNTPEYNLVLEKVFCGLAIEEPIPLDIVLQEIEIREAESLLESVIEHWKALRNTSIMGLRESFLKRDGLIKNQDGWLLQVERKTLDVLIESLPWGYSVIDFPWNNYLISVEW